MKDQIFLSYRWEDSAGYAIALRTQLRISFPDQLFMDRASIDPGAHIGQRIQAALHSCRAMIVIIGRDWLVPQVADAKDWVRREIATALKRKAVIIPVLVQGAKMPSPADLPANLKPLTRLLALDLTGQDWDYLVDRLVKQLGKHLAIAPRDDAWRQPNRNRPDPKSLEQRFHFLPSPTGSAPYHLTLESLVPAATLQTIRRSGSMVFHLAGNTGGARRPEAQRAVVYHMVRQCRVRRVEDRPAFFYHLGDVVFFHGERENYYEQFYKPYQDYPASIVGIPGNHDGDPSSKSAADGSLSGFLANFCAERPQLTPEAQDSARYAMTQPNPYWTLETPLATIIGLYTNVPEGGLLDDKQRMWLVTELKAAPRGIPLILTMHHPPYSIPRHSREFSASYMAVMLDQAIERSGRGPDAVFASHVMNYQRFTRRTRGRDVPFVIAGAGGYPRLHPMPKQGNGAPLQVPFRMPNLDVTLENYCNTQHGFLRVTITRRMLKGEYFTVPTGPGVSRGSATNEDTFAVDLARH
jgi:hypothetical protein